uniref:Potassium channel subfamily K member n=1 Tax=Monopterus albus TaxID=43700 RepID=A0A3Q3QL30_MONAL|nr:potassium channel subfamily K member 6-like [Monopterus albus]
MPCVDKSFLLLTGVVVFYFIYLLFGGLVFSIIERPVEDQLRRDMEALIQDFLNQSCVNQTSLEHFLVKVMKANAYGVSVLGNSSPTSNWGLASSMFFANTLVTTIGYGHSTPLSDGGKAFSIFYALLGVPFTMLVLAICVQRLMYPLVLTPVSLLQRSGLDPRPATVVHFLLLLVLAVLFFFMIPAAIFSTLEESWSFLDGIYFCFISLCTIGLGDFIAGSQENQKERNLYQISVMIYLFVGLMTMCLLLRVFHRMADLHGLTTFLQLPHSEGSDEDMDPIVENEQEDQDPSHLTDKAANRPLDPGSQQSYNSINKG